MVWFYVLLLTLLVEATTQVIVKSDIFYPIRLKLVNAPIVSDAITCGYCFSFWASLFWNFVFFISSVELFLVENVLINFVISVIIISRLSNYLHDFMDRVSIMYDIRYDRKKEREKER